MKKCPFCAEDIQDEAVKCRHCGEFLEKKPKAPWYFKTSIVVVALLSVGPLALPMVWFNPSYSRTKKVVITGITLVLTYWALKSLSGTMSMLNEYQEMLK